MAKVRGPEEQALAALEDRALHHSGCVNGLVVRLLREALGTTLPGQAQLEHHDLDEFSCPFLPNRRSAHRYSACGLSAVT